MQRCPNGFGESRSNAAYAASAPSPGETNLCIVVVEELLRRGDANLDGTMDISDPILVLNVLFLGIGQLLCLDAADANDDGTVDLSDAVTKLQVLFGGIGEIPDPGFQVCGPDPSDDELGCEEVRACE